MKDVAARQFPIDETFAFCPAYVENISQFEARLNSLSRLSHIRFKYAFSANAWGSTSWVTALVARLQNNHVYCIAFQLGGFENGPESTAHMVMLAMEADGSAKIFDSNLGEGQIEEGRVGQFLFEYLRQPCFSEYEIGCFHICNVDTTQNRY